MSDILEVAWFVMKAIFLIGLVSWMSSIESKMDDLSGSNEEDK